MDKYTVLKEYFGYDDFKQGQMEIIDSILDESDTVGIMPTGAGKSICYQVPAVLFDGCTLIISPLISLMKDQVQTLNASGIKSAYINSSLTFGQYKKVLEKAKNNEYTLIYVAPERLLNSDFIELCNNIKISMITIDEAHCVSQWGQNFRPSYLDISIFIDSLKNRPIVSAFTATATEHVKTDILKLLSLNSPFVLKTGFDRPNLYFKVAKPKDKLQYVMSFLDKRETISGIIYCSTRKAVEQVCNHLNRNEYSATRYHAGLSPSEKTQNQNDFLFDKKNIMVATNAFGMGIDKSNVSFVVHYNMPKDIESYYQEAGRAGRDGAPAECYLLFAKKDVNTNEYLINQNTPDERLDAQTIELIKEKDRQRLRDITAYCRTKSCLRKYIIGYFGDKASDYCGNCSNCKAKYENKDVTVECQKILSCVARMKQNFGVTRVCETLKGSKNKNLLKLGLDKLSTYGIMKDVSTESIKQIIEHMIDEGCIVLTNSEYPILKLNELSNEILMGTRKVNMMVSEKEQDKIKEVIVDFKDKMEGIDHNLFDKLKTLRKSIADDENVPAFVVFSDATLIDMCAKLPENEEEFLQVSGVGFIKLEKYGKDFLKTIAEFE